MTRCYGSLHHEAGHGAVCTDVIDTFLHLWIPTLSQDLVNWGIWNSMTKLLKAAPHLA